MPVEIFRPVRPNLIRPATLWNERHYTALEPDPKGKIYMYAVLKNDNAPHSAALDGVHCGTG